MPRETFDRYHLIALTPDLSHALGGRTAAGWLLPSIDKSPYAELPEQVRDALRCMTSGATVDVDLLHEAPLSQDNSTGANHYYFAAVITSPQTSLLVPVSELLSTRPLLPCQREALDSVLTRMREPVAPFDSSTRVADAMTWATQQIEDHTGERVTQIEPHRCMRYEYVVRLRTASGATFYFKGGPDRCADEACVTRWLATISPGDIPETVAMDATNQRWLYRELAGELLIGARLTLHTAVASVQALAKLQKRALASPSVPNLTQWRAAETHGDVDLPLTLVLSDFCGRNMVLKPDGGIGFIDLERSYWSYPVLPLWQFMRDVERTLDARESIERAFIAEWADVVPPAKMAAALLRLPTLGREFAMELASREREIKARELGAALAG